MPVVLAMNGKCYSDPEPMLNPRTDDSAPERPLLCLRFAEGKASSFVLKIVGIKDLSNGNGLETTERDSRHALNLTFLTYHVDSWTSYPLSPRSLVPVSFNLGRTLRIAEPKRLIRFRARACNISKFALAKLPRLVDAALELQMKNIISDITACHKQGKKMEFTCVVDEHRTDGATFNSMSAAL